MEMTVSQIFLAKQLVHQKQEKPSLENLPRCFHKKDSNWKHKRINSQLNPLKAVDSESLTIPNPVIKKPQCRIQGRGPGGSPLFLAPPPHPSPLIRRSDSATEPGGIKLFVRFVVNCLKNNPSRTKVMLLSFLPVENFSHAGVSRAWLSMNKGQPISISTAAIGRRRTRHF